MPPAPERTLRLALILGALTAFAPIALDSYLPAMPAIGRPRPKRFNSRFAC